MNPKNLRPRDLLDDTRPGLLSFAGERALILDAVALGLLRREMIQSLGESVARALLTRFGYWHGWRSAEALKDRFEWEDEAEWRRAGGWLHSLQGLVRVEALPDQRPGPYASALWHESYEAEQHLLHLGRHEDPVCWTLCGFASGYLSCSYGQEVTCRELECIGRGDAACRVLGKPRSEWAPEDLPPCPPRAESLPEDLARLMTQLREAERQLRARRQIAAGQSKSPVTDSGLIAASPAMRQLVSLAERAARVNVSVLITGESGSGKERIARLVHEKSPRAGRPFVAINCGAISESLIESELFGHSRGAFTGADRDRIGLFEAANGGTLFLDEVGELPLATQVKLLRVLQEREVRRLGENHSRKIDVRLIAATNREMSLEVESGRFRQDLFYRLKVVELRVLPLRERREDILPLAQVAISEIAKDLDIPRCSLCPAAADALQAWSWPGNVRELQNAIHRALITATEGKIGLADLPLELRTGAPIQETTKPENEPASSWDLGSIERRHILACLDAHGGRRAETAAALGIGVATLYRKLKSFEWNEGEQAPELPK